MEMVVEVRIAIKQQCTKNHSGVENKVYFAPDEVCNAFKTWSV